MRFVHIHMTDKKLIYDLINDNKEEYSGKLEYSLFTVKVLKIYQGY